MNTQLSNELDLIQDVSIPCDGCAEPACWGLKTRPLPCGCSSKTAHLLCEGHYRWIAERSSKQIACIPCQKRLGITLGEYISRAWKFTTHP